MRYDKTRILAYCLSAMVISSNAAIAIAAPGALANSKTIPIPGSPSGSATAFELLAKAQFKLAHHPISVSGYSFVPHVGKAWNVGAYKLRKGKQTLSEGRPDPYWPNSSEYSVVLPLVVSRELVKRQTPGDDLAGRIKAPLRALAPGGSFCASGSPEMVLEYANCGAQCLYTYSFFSLGPEFKKLFQIDAGNDGLNFVVLSDDGTVAALGVDPTFVDWNFSSACSPRPGVILRFRQDKAVLASAFMKTPPPDSAFMKKVVAETKKTFHAENSGSSAATGMTIPTELPANMLMLIYSGNAKLAWKLLDECWPAAKICKWELSVKNESVSKEQFLSEFMKKLHSSPYWTEIKSMNSL